MNLGFSTSRRGVPGLYSSGPITTDFIESRYAPFSIGIDGAAAIPPVANPLAGLFVADDNKRRIGARLTAVVAGTPAAVHIFRFTTGAVGGTPESLSIRLCKGLTSDPYQPDLAEGVAVQWMIPAATTAAWERIPLSRSALAIGDVIHVVMEQQTGTLGVGRSASFPSVKCRQPMPFTYKASNLGESYRDDYSAMMYAADNTALATGPYAAVCIDNGYFHPMIWVEYEDGTGFGQPYDIVDEFRVYGSGANSLSLVVEAPFSEETAFMAISMRGAGTGPVLPADDLYLTVKDGAANIIYGPVTYVNVTVPPTDRTFPGRPHWFGYQFPSGLLTLNAGSRYVFHFTSPGSLGVGLNDAFLVTLAGSSLTYFTGAGGVTTYAASGLSFSPYTPSGAASYARFGFMLRSGYGYGPFAVIDEFGNKVAGAGSTVTKAHAGQAVVYAGLSRNIGSLSDGISGGEMFVRMRDATTGLPPPGYTGDQIIGGPLGIVSSVGHNNEHTGTNWSLGFTMPATDIHLKIETGHAKVPGSLRFVFGLIVPNEGWMIIDDNSAVEMRVY